MPTLLKTPGKNMGLLLLLTVFFSGCWPLLQPVADHAANKKGYSPLSTPGMSPDLVSLEIAVATLDGPALEKFNQVWQKADVQSLPLQVRKTLDRNGFRAGLLGNQLPGELTSALSWSQALLTPDGDILFNSKTPLPQNTTNQAFAIKQLEQLNSGDQHWIPCSALLPQVSWSVETDGTTRSGTCDLAQCGFVISQVPAGDHAIKLWLRPMIRHGESKLRYGIDQDTLLMKEQQQRLRLDELDFVQRIRLGQTFVMSTTSTPAGLGQQFFASGRFATSRQILLIRPVRIGQDDLFAPGKTSRRLSTNLD